MKKIILILLIIYSSIFYSQTRITAKYNKILVDSVAHTYATDACLSKVYSNEVDSNGLSNNWETDYCSFSHNKVYHFIVYSDSIIFIDSTQVLDGTTIISIPWIDSDSILTIANNNGGGDFILNNPNCLIDAYLVNYIVPPFTTNWFVNYNGPDTSLTIKINAENGEIITSIFDKYEVNPNGFIIYQNYPNPFNPNTIIDYFVTDYNSVLIRIYDINGNEIIRENVSSKQLGIHHYNFDGEGLSSGVYFCNISNSKNSKTIKMLLLK